MAVSPEDLGHVLMKILQHLALKRVAVPQAATGHHYAPQS
jgi:hypothetical protein